MNQCVSADGEDGKQCHKAHSRFDRLAGFVSSKNFGFGFQFIAGNVIKTIDAKGQPTVVFLTVLVEALKRSIAWALRRCLASTAPVASPASPMLKAE